MFFYLYNKRCYCCWSFPHFGLGFFFELNIMFLFHTMRKSVQTFFNLMNLSQQIKIEINLEYTEFIK